MASKQTQYSPESDLFRNELLRLIAMKRSLVGSKLRVLEGQASPLA